MAEREQSGNNSGAVQHCGRESKSQRVKNRIGSKRNLGAMGITMEHRKDTDERNRPLDRPASTQRLLATLSAALGIDQNEIDKRWPTGTALYPESGPLWELWA